MEYVYLMLSGLVIGVIIGCIMVYFDNKKVNEEEEDIRLGIIKMPWDEEDSYDQ